MLSLNCKNVQHVEIYLPCNFKVNPSTHFGVIVLFSSPDIVTTERPSVRPLTFHILINSSEVTEPIWTKLWWNGPWMAPSKMCPVIPTSNQDGRQAKNRKKGDEILIVHCCFSISQNELKF
jgi:hypothetical protein